MTDFAVTITSTLPGHEREQHASYCARRRGTGSLWTAKLFMTRLHQLTGQWTLHKMLIIRWQQAGT